jgi:hypothetical protein
MKMQNLISPQRHRDTEENQPQDLLLGNHSSLICQFCLSLCLCVSVVNAFEVEVLS